jgi:hypothetical protein
VGLFFSRYVFERVIVERYFFSLYAFVISARVTAPTAGATVTGGVVGTTAPPEAEVVGARTVAGRETLPTKYGSRTNVRIVPGNGLVHRSVIYLPVSALYWNIPISFLLYSVFSN